MFFFLIFIIINIRSDFSWLLQFFVFGMTKKDNVMLYPLNEKTGLILRITEN